MMLFKVLGVMVGGGLLYSGMNEIYTLRVSQGDDL